VSQVNADTWRSLSKDERQALLKASAVMPAYIPFTYHQRENTLLDEVRKRGGTVHEADPALIHKTREFVQQDMKTIVDYFAKTYGVKNGQEMLTTFRPILEKWVGLVQDVNSLEQLTELYWNEIYSKIDVETH